MRTLAHLPDYFNHSLTTAEKRSVWGNGEPVPWLTYPAICYLEQLNFTRQLIFEYGCGSSTFYWAKHARKVTSVEHDEAWYNQIKSDLPANAELFLATGQPYVECVEKNAPHNVIVVDGRWRPECVRHCLPYLSEEGMIILDNSERHPDLTAFLRDKSLIQVDFVGHGPINVPLSVTSIFLSRSFRTPPRSSAQPRYLPGIFDASDKPEGV